MPDERATPEALTDERIRIESAQFLDLVQLPQWARIVDFARALASRPPSEPAPEPTDAMVTAYLEAQQAAVHRMDTEPLSSGVRPRDACREGLRAALAAQEAHPAPPAIPRNVLMAAYEQMIREEAGEAQPAAAQESLRAALAELVACKDMKGEVQRLRSDPYYTTQADFLEIKYERRRDAAWEAARAALTNKEK